MSIVSVYAVFADIEEAERIGRTVVEERLAACINILGACRSVYLWEGKIETAEEVPAILKTHSWQADELIARIAALHSYDVPCIAACINILGACRSIYLWEGKIETAEEVPAILKTHSWQADELIARIAALHSYDVPCIAVWSVDKLLLSYSDWVEGETVRKR